MKKTREQMNAMYVTLFNVEHAHKTKKEACLRHLLRLTYNLIDDIWEDLSIYLTEKEQKDGPRRISGGFDEKNREDSRPRENKSISKTNSKPLHRTIKTSK